MTKFLPLFLCFFALGSSVPNVDPWGRTKKQPDHVGIEKEIVAFEIMYDFEARIRGIKFKTPVTIVVSSFKMKKGKGTVVGLCTYGKNFREIDINMQYWHKSTWMTKRTLIYHEMTHCFCGRFHTWSGGEYPDAEKMPKAPLQVGLLGDGCPASIMYPIVVSDDCVAKHWDMYDSEMFDGCNPY